MTLSKSKFKKSKNIITKKGSSGGIVILLLDNDSHLFEIEGIALQIWKKIDGKKSLSAIVKEVAKRTKAPEKVLSVDSDKFVKKLLKNGLITKI